MPVGVVPHYRPCLLVNSHCNWHFASRMQMEEGCSAIISDMSADTVPLSDMPVCTVKLDQICMLGSFIQIREFVKCCAIR